MQHYQLKKSPTRISVKIVTKFGKNKPKEKQLAKARAIKFILFLLINIIRFHVAQESFLAKK